jgi:hypothetical protein
MDEPVVVVWGMAVGCSCVPRGARHSRDIPEGIGAIGRLGGRLGTHGEKEAEAGQRTVDCAPAQALLEQVQAIGYRVLGRRCIQVGRNLDRNWLKGVTAKGLSWQQSWCASLSAIITAPKKTPPLRVWSLIWKRLAQMCG